MLVKNVSLSYVTFSDFNSVLGIFSGWNLSLNYLKAFKLIAVGLKASNFLGRRGISMLGTNCFFSYLYLSISDLVDDRGEVRGELRGEMLFLCMDLGDLLLSRFFSSTFWLLLKFLWITRIFYVSGSCIWEECMSSSEAAAKEVHLTFLNYFFIYWR